MSENDKKFLPDTEVEELAKEFEKLLGEKSKGHGKTLAGVVNDFLSKKYANITNKPKSGVSSIGPKGEFRSH